MSPTNLDSEYWLVVVTGPFASGKTSFVDSIGEPVPPADAESPDDEFYPHGSMIPAEDVTLYLHATPGARRFDFMWEVMANGRMIGFVVTMNSAIPETFREVKSILETFRAYLPLPCVVAANFQDRPDAWDTDSLHAFLRLPDHIPVIPCVATEKESVKAVLITLLEKVLESLDEPDEALGFS
jgi:uncharacterized protein